MWGKENSDKINKMHIQGDVFHLPQNACLVFENDALYSSKIMLTNTGKYREILSVTEWRGKHLKKA